VEYSENDSHGLRRNELTGSVLLEHYEHRSSMTSRMEDRLGGNVVAQWITVAAKILVIPTFPKFSLFPWFTVHYSI
jgi:hypothetical protein